jgi:four helix bundle protein
MKTDVWSVSINFNTDVYHFCQNLSNSDGFAIQDQLRRASLSVPTNVAEGLGRESLKEQLRFLGIAYSSLMEVVSLLVTSQKIGLSDEDTINSLIQQSEKVSRLINGYRRYLRNQIK